MISDFRFRHTGSVSGAVQTIKKPVMARELKAEMDRLEKVFQVINATGEWAMCFKVATKR
jgi:hypothetical protein